MRPRASLAQDDQALAGVVGFVMILAIAVSYYAYVVQTDVPRWGAQNEREWDALVGSAMSQLARDAENAAGTRAVAAAHVPRPPAPEGFDIPLFGRTQPIDPSGTVTFAPAGACGGVNVTQSISSKPNRSFASAGGCISFDAAPVYSAPFGYIHENGALLRVQGAEAVVLRAPPLAISPFVDADGAPVRFDVVLNLEELRGQAFSASAQGAGVHLSLAPDVAPASAALPLTNADQLTVVFSTAHPEAWKAWLNDRLGAWRVNDPAFCPTGGCVRIEPSAAGSVTLVIEGPRAVGTGKDLALTVIENSLVVSAR